MLTSLRTIGGAIGTAVFVGILSSVSASSAASYGDKAAIHGLNVTFFVMSAFTLILLFISIFLVKERKNKNK